MSQHEDTPHRHSTYIVRLLHVGSGLGVTFQARCVCGHRGSECDTHKEAQEEALEHGPSMVKNPRVTPQPRET